MELMLPRQIEVSDTRVVLDDGRIVTISGTGYVSVQNHNLGNEDYSLELPTVEWVGDNCDNPASADRHGYADIQVRHRH